MSMSVSGDEVDVHVPRGNRYRLHCLFAKSNTLDMTWDTFTTTQAILLGATMYNRLLPARKLRNLGYH